MGSRAYGLDDERSDTDRRGIYLPPADVHWSLYDVPEQLERESTQECYWELEKFLMLGLKANPTILECLYSPIVETASPIALELLTMRDAFLSKRVFAAYQGYVTAQFKRMQVDLRTRGEIRWKHVMHLIRLQLAGIDALRRHEIRVRIENPDVRSHLLAIKHGAMAWEEIEVWRLALDAELSAAFAATLLPDEPDTARVNAFLIKARRSAL
jgi:uncharacterized protein